LPDTSQHKTSRIGVIYPNLDGWAGGSRFIRILLHALGAVCPSDDAELLILAEQQKLSGLCSLPFTRVIPVRAPGHFRGESRLRHILGMREKSALFNTARSHRISVVLPVRTAPFRSPGLQTIGWIPDFQHVYLPEFFSDAKIAYRNESFRQLAGECTLVMLSSQTALKHFAAFVPEYTHKARVISFPSLFAFDKLPENIGVTQQRFRIPAKFALVSNQFWRHKNHTVVIRAICKLQRGGIRVPVVMTGLPADARDPNNETMSRVLQSIARAGLNTQIFVLGMVSERDLANLMRTAALVIQPSRFEGWSTVIQECKALGRPLLCSDIPVHREQAPGALGFFPCDRPDALAELIATYWPALEPGPDRQAENAALAREREFARKHSESLLNVCREAECA